MYRNAEEMVKEVQFGMRGGKKNVEITHIFSKEEMRNEARLCAKLTLEPGSSIGLHPHNEEEEIYYILSGTGLVEDSSKKYEVKPGDAVITGGGESHSIENTGNVPLELFAIVMLF